MVVKWRLGWRSISGQLAERTCRFTAFAGPSEARVTASSGGFAVIWRAINSGAGDSSLNHLNLAPIMAKPIVNTSMAAAISPELRWDAFGRRRRSRSARNSAALEYRADLSF